MASGRYDITAEQGVTFKLHLRYKDHQNVNVDLDPDLGWTGRMQVRRSGVDSDLILHVTTTGVTGGGSTGEFTAGSGGTGHSGGVLIGIDAESMSNVPKGNHFYDLEIVKGDTVTRLIEGRFSVDREITR